MWRIVLRIRKLRFKSPVISRSWSQSPSLAVRQFVNRENSYVHGILTNAGISGPPATLCSDGQTIESRVELESLLNQNYRLKTATEIVNTFKLIAPICCRDMLRLSDAMFDRLVDGLMDNAEKLSDEELLQLLDVLHVLPSFTNITDNNYHDIWSCLDDISCWRITRWNAAMLFAVSERWYRLQLASVGDFIFRALEKLSFKPSTRLTRQQIVHAFFLFNLSRHRAVPFDFEHAVEQCVDEMSVDELAVIALGFFKTQSKVKIARILSVMLRKAKAAAEGGVHDMTLCAILKIVRFSANPLLADQIHDFLVHITPTLTRSSILCVMHAALLGSTLQLEYTPVLKLAAQRIVAQIDDVAAVRLKDIERLLLTLAMFDYDPETTPCIFKSAVHELGADRRNPERVKYARSYVSALGYLAIRGFYDTDLLAQVLAPDYVADVYGKSAKMFPRELFVLDTNIDIEVSGYSGPKIDIIKRRKIVRWLTEFTPSHTQTRRINAADRLILDVRDTLVEIIAGERNLLVEHVLPHYVRADFVICRDIATGAFIPPFGFYNYELGDVYRAPTSTTHRFYAIVIVGWNNTIRNTSRPVGMINMKCRHLAAVGFHPVTVVWNEFSALAPAAKKQHLLDKLLTWKTASG